MADNEPLQNAWKVPASHRPGYNTGPVHVAQVSIGDIKAGDAVETPAHGCRADSYGPKTEPAPTQ